MSEPRIAWTFKPTGAGSRRGERQRMARQMAALSQAPLFASLSKRHLRKVAEVSSETSFRAGEEIVKEGVSGSVFYVILEGEAKVTKGRRTLRRLGPGEFFGEMSTIVGMPRTASVVCETPIHCVTLSARDLRSVLADEPGLALKVLEHITRRLAERERPLVG